MAHIERMLNVKIILTGKLKDALDWGITEEDFTVDEERSVFTRLCDDFRSSNHPGSVMGPKIASMVFPMLDLSDVDPSTTLEHVCQKMREIRLQRTMQSQLKDITTTSDYDPVKAYKMVEELQQSLRELEPGKTTDISFKRGIEKVMERYAKMKMGECVGKFPWPWDPLQEKTYGVQEDDYVVLYGRPKSMKTWVLVFLIAYAITQGARVLFYTKEMTDLNLYMRLAACLMEVDYDEIRLGKLTPQKEKELAEMSILAASLEADHHIMCLSAKDARGRDTVSWLRGKVEKYRPDVVFIDGIYLMSVPKANSKMKDNERVQAISREIRDMILGTHVPVIATIQANRAAASHAEANLDEIAFSDALSQDCTLAIRVIKNKDALPQTISMVVGGVREFNLDGFRIYGIPCTNFAYHSLLTARDVETAKKDDDKEEEEAAKQKNKKGKKQDPGAWDKHMQNLP